MCFVKNVAFLLEHPIYQCGLHPTVSFPVLNYSKKRFPKYPSKSNLYSKCPQRKTGYFFKGQPVFGSYIKRCVWKLQGQRCFIGSYWLLFQGSACSWFYLKAGRWKFQGQRCFIGSYWLLFQGSACSWFLFKSWQMEISGSKVFHRFLLAAFSRVSLFLVLI